MKKNKKYVLSRIKFITDTKYIKKKVFSHLSLNNNNKTYNTKLKTKKFVYFYFCSI